MNDRPFRGAATYRRSQLGAWAEVFALCGLVFAQPVFDILGRSPEFFVHAGARTSDLLILAASLVILPPLFVGVLAFGLARILPNTMQVIHLPIRATLFSLLSVQVLKQLTPFRGTPLVLAAGVLGTAILGLCLRHHFFLLWIRYLAPAPITFAILFLTTSDIASLVRPHNSASIAALAPATAPVVMIVFDEFPLMSLLSPSGEIDPERYPNLARFSADATWFRNTTAVSGETTQAIPSLLTGRYPEHALAPVAADHPNNLFTLLAGSHQLNVHEAVTALCSMPECTASQRRHRTRVHSLLGDAGRLWLRLVSPKDGERDLTASLSERTGKNDRDTQNALSTEHSETTINEEYIRSKVRENQPTRLKKFLESLQPSGQPEFHFLHVLLPHVPYRYLPSGFEYPGRLFGNTSSGARSDEPWPARHELQKHLLQASYTDLLFGQILDQLHSRGLYERSLIVVVSDHGVSFVPGDHRRSVTDLSTGQAAWVPFFVKQPRQTSGEITDRNVLTVDVLPTIAEVLGSEVPWDVDGRSALSDPPRGTEKLWWEYRGDKPPLHQTIDGAHWLPRVLAGFRIGEGSQISGIEALYAIGPYPDLVGQPVSDQILLPPKASGAELDDFHAYHNVAPATGVIPAQVSGRLTVPRFESKRLRLALAVNGMIAAVGEVFREGQTPFKFSVMASEQYFRAGTNDLALFLVHHQQGSSVQLEPLPIKE